MMSVLLTAVSVFFLFHPFPINNLAGIEKLHSTSSCDTSKLCAVATGEHKNINLDQ